MNDADAMFAAAFQFAERIVAQRAAHREALKDARNARRRARYVTAPPKPKLPAPVVEDNSDLWDEPGCCCHVVPMPPCGWCESGAHNDD